MSTLAYVDSVTITQADGAQSSRVPVPLPDDPYVAVRQAYEEFEAFEPSGTRTVSSHSLVSSDSTAPLSPDHPLTYVSPTPTPTRVSFHRRTARMASYRSSYETSSSSSPTLLVRKRYRGTSKLILDTNSEGDELGEEDTKEDESLDADDERERENSKDEGPDIEEDEEAAPKEQEGEERISAFRKPTLVTWVDPKDSRVYIDIPTYVPLAAPVQTPPSLKWSLGSLPVSPSSLVVPSPIASPVATPAATISVDED
ncbi:hypothetical protein Tco_1240945 [Tanacetum coccineum]